MMLAHQVMDRIGSAASAGGIMPSTHVAPSGARWPCAACALVVRARGESTGSAAATQNAAGWSALAKRKATAA